MTVSGKDRRELVEEIRTLRTHLGRLERRNAERTRPDRELSESQEQFKAIFDDAPVGLYRTTPDGRILAANSALIGMLGYRSFDELARRDLENEGYEPACPRSVFKQRIEREGKVIGLESAWKKSDGTTLYVRESAQAVRDKLGKTLYYQGTVEDVTEQRQAKKALRESEEVFRALTANLSEGVNIVDENLCCLFANPAGEEIFGVGPGGLVGRTLYEFVSDQSLAIVEEQRSKRREGIAASYDLEIIRPDGQKRQLIVTGTPRFSQEGKYVGAIAVFFDVTEKKQAEQMLRKAHDELEIRVQERTAELQRTNEALQAEIAERVKAEKLISERARIIDSTTDSVIMTDAGGVVTLWNRGAERIFGYTSEEMLGQPIGTLYSEEGQGRLAEIVQALLRGEEIATTEVTCVHKDGSLVELAISLLPLIDDRGNVTDFVGISRDITEHKRAQETLRESENRYRTVIENAGEGIVVVQDGKLRFVNARHTLVTGRSQEESTSRPFAEFIHPDDRERVAEIHAARLRGEPIPRVYEFRIIDKDGQTKWLENNGVVIEWDGKPASLNFLRDITERKKAEDELRIRAEILENMVEGVHITDEKGIIVLTNPGLDAMFGYERGELTGKHVSILNNLPQEENALFVDSVIDHLRMQGTWSGEVCNIKKDGTQFISSVRVSALDISGKKHWISVQHDITDRKRAEEEKSRLLKAIETAKESISITTPDGVIVYGNEAMDDLFGYEKGELIGQPVSVLTSGPGAESLVREALTALEEKGHWEGEVVNKKKDGTEFITYATTSAVKDEKGHIVNLVGTQYDITERKKAEEALRTSEERFRRVFEEGPIGMVLTSRDLKFFSANPAFCKMLGYTQEEMSSKTFLDVTHPAHRGADRENIEKMWRGEIQHYATKKRYLGKNGDIHWGSLSTSLIRGQEGEPLYALAMVEDITERERVQETLRETTGLLETIFAHTHILVAYLDPQFNFVRVNRAYAEADGREPSFFVGRNHFALYPSAENEAIFRKVVEIGVPYFAHAKPFEYAEHPERGVGYWDWSLVPIKQQDGVVSGLVLTLVNVTEQKRAEQALREREATLTSIFQAAPVGIGLERGWVLSRVNETICEMLGCSADELIGQHAKTFYPSEEDYERVKDESRRQIREKGKGTVETQWKHRDGRIIDVLLSTTVLDPADLSTGVTFTALDITERKTAEQSLRESEEKFRTLAEQSPNMIFINKKGRIVYANRKCEETMGYTREEFYAPDFDFRVLVAPESADVIRESFTRHSRGQEIEPYDYCLISKQGRRIEAINASRLIQYEGETAILGIVTDITERKKAERALRESQERLKILFESAPDAIYVTDLRGRFVDGNRAAEEMAGFTKGEVIGKSLAESGLLFGEDLSRAAANLRKVAAGEPSGPNEYAVRRKNGSMIDIEVRTFPVRIGGEILSLGIARDVTARKHAEQKLLEDREQLKSLASQLSLTEDRERHRLAGVLHDQIGQSLVISKIKLDQLRKGGSSGAIVKALDEVSACLGQVIGDTRTLTFDLSYPILYELGFEAAVAEWLMEHIQEEHGIETDFEDDGQPKPLDDDIRALLFRNVRELLINVVKHAQAQRVKVTIRRVKDQIRTSVEDDGVGFDPVEVTAMAAKRAEFGLFSIRERLEQLGGRFEVVSAPGRGTRITMTAPLRHTANEEQG